MSYVAVVGCVEWAIWGGRLAGRLEVDVVSGRSVNGVGRRRVRSGRDGRRAGGLLVELRGGAGSHEPAVVSDEVLPIHWACCGRERLAAKALR